MPALSLVQGQLRTGETETSGLRKHAISLTCARVAARMEGHGEKHVTKNTARRPVLPCWLALCQIPPLLRKGGVAQGLSDTQH